MIHELYYIMLVEIPTIVGFPGSAVVKNLPAKAEDTRDAGLIPELWRFPGGGNATHSSILAWEIPYRGVCWAAVHGVTKSQTELSH